MKETLGARARRKVREVSKVVGLSHRATEMEEVLEAMAGPWFGRSLEERFPTWATSDGSPLEISMPVDEATPELRFGCEAQGVTPSFRANWDAAIATLPELQRRGAHLGVLESLLPLIEPLAGFEPPLGIWTAVAFLKNGPPVFRAYVSLDTAAERGHGVAEMMERLGCGDVGARTAAACGRDAKVGMLALDLIDSPKARTKLYTMHVPLRATAYPSIERVGALSSSYVAGDASSLVEALAPLPPDGPFPIFLCSTVHAVGSTIVRTSMNARLPDARSVGLDSATLTERLAQYLRDGGSDSSFFRRVAELFGGGDRTSFDDYTFVSAQRESDRKRVVAYFSPKLYDRAAPSADADRG